MQYRPEIDGLRAIAVLPVVLFHAGLQPFAGGFVGVDVFFVISGYLITSILIKDLARGTFSLAHFYERRARRILPALFCVVLVCLPFAAAWMMPRDLKDFAQSLAGVATFTSNMLFWYESGYFDTASSLKPLLHTWSLAVEEQFYIVFPLVLMVLWPRGVRTVALVLAVVGLLSLALAHWGVHAMPSAAFYMLPTRCWELLLGTFCALYLHNRAPLAPSLAPSLAVQVGGVLGLVLIAGAVFLFDETVPFPGLYALVPTLGAVLIILCAVPGTYVCTVLGTRVLVGLGVLSYSTYLWHHPLFAFVQYRSLTEPGLGLMLGLSVLSVLLAWVTWKYVETPFRAAGRIPTPALFRTSALAGVAFLALGVAGTLTDGFRAQILQYRVSPQQADLYATILEATEVSLKDEMFDDGRCRFWSPTVDAAFEQRFARCVDRFGPATVVLGDSHAMNVYNAFAKADVLPFVVGVAQGGCRPHDMQALCHYAGFDRFAMAPGQVGKIARIIYHQSGSYFVADSDGRVDSPKAFTTGTYTTKVDSIVAVKAYLTRLSNGQGAPVTWLGPFVEYRNDPIKAVYNDRYFALHPASVAIFGVLNQQLDARFKAAPFDYLAFEQLYDVPGSALQNGCFLFRDIDHFSACGERLIGASQGVQVFLQGDMRQLAARRP